MKIYRASDDMVTLHYEGDSMQEAEAYFRKEWESAEAGMYLIVITEFVRKNGHKQMTNMKTIRVTAL